MRGVTWWRARPRAAPGRRPTGRACRKSRPRPPESSPRPARAPRRSSRSTPPSTSMSAASPRLASSARAADDLVDAARDEPLSAKAGIDRHHQQHVEARRSLRQSRRATSLGLIATPARSPSWRMRVSVRCRCGRTSACTVRLDAPASANCVEIAIGLADHQMHVERHAGDPLQRGDDRRADRDVRHEVPVHHVDVNQVGAASFDPRDLVGQPREIGREDRRRDAHGHRETSSVMASYGITWIAGLRRLPDDDAGRDAGIGHLARHRDAETLRPQARRRVRMPTRADQIGHDVADALVAAVDEQRHLRAASLGRRDPGRRPRPGRSPRVRISARAAMAMFSPLSVISAVRSGRSTTLGTTGSRWPSLRRTRTGPLTAHDDAGLRLLRQDVIGRHFRIGPLRPHRRGAPVRAEPSVLVACDDRLAAQVGHLHLARTRRDAQRGEEEDAERDRETGGKQEEPAGVPDAFAHWTGLQIEAHQALKVYYSGFRLRASRRRTRRGRARTGVVCRNPACIPEASRRPARDVAELDRHTA